VNYFDTAWPYHGGMSERIMGRVLGQYTRESYYLADKFPGHQIFSDYTPERFFEEQLERCQVEYFDFYLLHNVYEKSIHVYKDDKWKIVDYLLEQKRNGRIKHLGLMDHGSVLEMEKNAEYLVNIGNENPNLIPSKIFEYMRFGKPIISTYRTDNDTSLEPLKKYGNACFIDERLPAEDNARTLLDFINSENKKPISPEEMQKEFYLNTPTAFVDVINSLKEK